MRPAHLSRLVTDKFITGGNLTLVLQLSFSIAITIFVRPSQRVESGKKKDRRHECRRSNAPEV
jgi:hypothetical protein